MQDVLSEVLGKTSLADLLCNEEQMLVMLTARTPSVAVESSRVARGAVTR
jgi:hypothetical protein